MNLNITDYFNAILKRKSLILVIIVISIIVSFGKGIIENKVVYDAKAIIRVSPIDLKSEIEINSNTIVITDIDKIDFSNKIQNKMLGILLKRIKYPSFSLEKIGYLICAREFKEEALKDMIRKENSISNEIDNIKIVMNPNENSFTLNTTSANINYPRIINEAILKYIPIYLEAKKDEKIDEILENLNTEMEKEKKNIDIFKDKLNSTKLTKAQYLDINNDYVLSSQSFEAYKLIDKEAQYISKINIVNLMNIQKIYEDSKPIKISSVDHKRNITLAAVLGFIASILFSIFIELKSRKSQKKGKNDHQFFVKGE